MRAGRGLLGTISSPISGFPGKTPACLVTPFISPLCGARSLPKPLGYSTLLVPNLRPAWGPWPSFHSVPWAGSHALSGEHGGTAGHLGWGLNPPTWFVVDSMGHVVMTSGRKVREEHFPECPGSQGPEGLYLSLYSQRALPGLVFQAYTAGGSPAPDPKREKRNREGGRRRKTEGQAGGESHWPP